MRPGSSPSTSKAFANATFRKTGHKHTKAQHHKADYALRAAAIPRAGVDPRVLDEMTWWRTNHLRFWTLEALVTCLRAAAERIAETVPAICGRIASRHDVQLAAAA